MTERGNKVSETVEYFEDIDIGDEIAELDICPTTADVVRFVDVARMQSGRFTDDEYARKEGCQERSSLGT